MGRGARASSEPRRPSPPSSVAPLARLKSPARSGVRTPFLLSSNSCHSLRWAALRWRAIAFLRRVQASLRHQVEIEGGHAAGIPALLGPALAGQGLLERLALPLLDLAEGTDTAIDLVHLQRMTLRELQALGILRDPQGGALRAMTAVRRHILRAMNGAADRIHAAHPAQEFGKAGRSMRVAPGAHRPPLLQERGAQARTRLGLTHALPVALAALAAQGLLTLGIDLGAPRRLQELQRIELVLTRARLVEGAHHLAVLLDERLRLLDGGQRARRKILAEEGDDILGAHALVRDHARQGVHTAIGIDQSSRTVAGRQDIAQPLRRVQEGVRTIALPEGPVTCAVRCSC